MPNFAVYRGRKEATAKFYSLFEFGSLRTADAFPVVASLPPIFGGREATTGNASAVRRL